MNITSDIRERPLIDELINFAKQLDKSEQEQLRAFFLGIEYMKKLQETKQPA